MSNKPPRSTAATALTWTGVVVICIALYVLSIGPVLMFSAARRLPCPEFFGVFYAPIVWLEGNTSVGDGPLVGYAKWWRAIGERWFDS